MSTALEHVEVSKRAADGRVTVGLAVLAPSGQMTDMLFLAVGHAMKKETEDGGVRAGVPGGFFRPGYCVCLVETADRNKVIACLLTLAKRLGLESCCEIAWFDAAEDYWRTVFPEGAPLLFSRFLEERDMEAAAKDVEESQRRIKDALERQRVEGSDNG